MRIDKEAMAYLGFFSGACFLLGLGIFDLFEPGFRRAGVALIALATVIGPLAFNGMRQKAKSGGS